MTKMSLKELKKHIKYMDTSDPACMDIIKIYFEDLENEDNAFMELLLYKLENEEITWPQPWYQQTKCLTRPVKEPDEIPDETFCTGSMTKEEIDRIHKNWTKFRKKYDVPDKIICFARWRNKRKSKYVSEEYVRHFVISYLARGVKRNLYQILRHVMTHYGGPVKGDYTPLEENIMEICFRHQPKNAVIILSKVLGREPRGIYKRLGYNIDGKPEKREKLKWTLPLATKFLKLLMEYSNCSVEELKYKKIDVSIWLRLEEDMGQHYRYLQAFWEFKLHNQLFVKEYITMRALRKRIFKILKKSTYAVWHDIRWKELLNEFADGYTHHFIYNTAYLTVKHFHNLLRRPLEEVVNYALAYIKINRLRYTMRLRTLKLNEEGNLEPVLYN
ncbi:uncharacterized protein LOC131845981 [Achroia grisella]|uniref:uncharacterized protein LOC131845981 n=1 Tax=Achroia grisella TaxID=688607 RepID=UPI0027D30AAC|nr:uncharacterized protein LOC131845981 [Achroia grisella]